MTRLLALAALATALTLTALSVTPSAAASRKSYAQCMTDDGYGRLRPCSALYKREHPNWRAGNECMTDDGSGRFRPCRATAAVAQGARSDGSFYHDRYGLGHTDSARHHPTDTNGN